MIITIDGPAGSGKSTAAKLIAKQKKIAYLDTGAMYRAVTLLAMEQGLDATQQEAVGKIAKSINLRFAESAKGQLVFINNEDRTAEIRSREVDRAVSAISALQSVRTEMVSMQRKIAENSGDVVGEGRDLGSVVFPNAKHRFYLDADPTKRAARRAEQRGEEATPKHTEEIQQRDKLDSSRKTSPLAIPEGATVIDNTLLSIDETVSKILEFIA